MKQTMREEGISNPHWYQRFKGKHSGPGVLEKWEEKELEGWPQKEMVEFKLLDQSPILLNSVPLSPFKLRSGSHRSVSYTLQGEQQCPTCEDEETF